MMVGYIEPLPLPVVDLSPAIVVVLVACIFAWCFGGLALLVKAINDEPEAFDI